MNRNSIKKRLMGLTIVGAMVFGSHVMAQDSAGLSQLELDHNSIMTNCLTFNPLDAEVSSVALTDLSSYAILDHGVKFHHSNNFEISDREVSLITKGDVNSSTPYFIFHTLRVNDTDAFARYNLVYFENGQEMMKTVEIFFKKQDADWIVEKYSL